MRVISFVIGLFVAGLMGAAQGAAQSAPDLRLPYPVTAHLAEASEYRSYDLPLGAWKDGFLSIDRLEGDVTRQAWQLEAPRVSLLELAAPLRDQLHAQGWQIAYECGARVCGGFDFRFGTEVMAEPAMHMDMADYYYLGALQKNAGLSVIISRSAGTAFLQVISVVPRKSGIGVPSLTGTSAPAIRTPHEPPAAQPEGAPLIEEAVSVESLAQNLDAGLAVVLEDLAFASGSARLAVQEYPSMRALADWLKADTARKVILVGHSDGSGSAAGNVALSGKRAEAVATALYRDYGVGKDQITTKGIGPFAPRSSNRTPEGQAQNRRVEVVPDLH